MTQPKTQPLKALHPLWKELSSCRTSKFVGLFGHFITKSLMRFIIWQNIGLTLISILFKLIRKSFRLLTSENSQLSEKIHQFPMLPNALQEQFAN